MKVKDIMKIDDEYFAIVRHNEEAFLAHIDGLCRAKYGKVNDETTKQLLEEIKKDQKRFEMTSSIENNDFRKFYIVEK